MRKVMCWCSQELHDGQVSEDVHRAHKSEVLHFCCLCGAWGQPMGGTFFSLHFFILFHPAAFAGHGDRW